MNERVVKNPNFKNNGEFHRSLAARGAGAKDWPNSHTEVEHLGGGKFGASIGAGHRVFFDKADGNKPKKHKLTDERATKDYILIQSAKCAVEVYPYYAKYFDPTHEIVRLYEERWVVQRLFKTIPQEEWRDVGAWNPVMELKEEDSRVSVTITYQTDYGKLTVRYAQGDGNNLAHHVLFVNESGGTETFRVLQRWAGIVGGKCNSKDLPLNIDTPEEASFLSFHSAEKPKRRFNITNNLRGTLYETVHEKTGRIIEQTYWDEELGGEVTVEVEETRPVEKRKTEKCLHLPVRVETHAQGMKADFIFERWTLVPTEVLTIGSPYALSFDGENDYVSAPDSSSLDLSGDHSLEAWVKFEETPASGTRAILCKWVTSGGQQAYSWYLYNGTIQRNIRNAANTAQDVVRWPWTPTLGVWHYLVTTWKALEPNPTGWKLYIDGVDQGTPTMIVNNNVTDINNSTAPLMIGADQAGSSSRLNAIEDEVRISDIVRTQAEVTENWNNGCGKPFEVDEHTVALWHMDEGEGGVIHDESPNGNDGTIHGASWTDGFPFGHDCPDTATLDDPTEDGDTKKEGANVAACVTAAPSRRSADVLAWGGTYNPLPTSSAYRAYVEWPITSLAGETLTANPKFKYHGYTSNATSGEINPLTEEAPSGATDANLWGYIATGVAYVDPFEVVVDTNQEVDLGASAKTDLQAAIDTEQSWFAIGFQSPDDECPPVNGSGSFLDNIWSEEKAVVDPKPTLYVEYGVGIENKSANMGSKMVAAGLI